MEDSLQTQWKHFAAKVNGTFKSNKDTNYFHNHEACHLNYNFNGRKIIITVYSQQIPERGKSPFLTHYTKVDIPFKNTKAIHFKLYKADNLSKILRFFAKPSIKTANEQFNTLFTLTGSPEEEVKIIFSNEHILKSIIGFNDLYLTIIKNKNFTDFQLKSDEDVLQVQVNFVLTNKVDIDNLHDLATSLLKALTP